MSGIENSFRQCLRVTHAYWEKTNISNPYHTPILRLREEYIRVGRTMQRLMLNAITFDRNKQKEWFKNSKSKNLMKKLVEPYEKQNKDYCDIVSSFINCQAYEIETQWEKCKNLKGETPLKHDMQFSRKICKMKYAHIYKPVERMEELELTRELYYCANIGMADKGAKVCRRLL